jgi:hypothetical protein
LVFESGFDFECVVVGAETVARLEELTRSSLAVFFGGFDLLVVGFV